MRCDWDLLGQVLLSTHVVSFPRPLGELRIQISQFVETERVDMVSRGVCLDAQEPRTFDAPAEHEVANKVPFAN